jgi:hypothetical protein
VKGQKTGGRKKGVPNRKTEEIADKLARLRCDPIEGMAHIATGNITCPTCAGKKRAKYSIGMAGPYWDPEKGAEMACRTCTGTGKEPIAPELKGKMYAELAQYVAPKRKAIEVTGKDGGPVIIAASSHDERI